MKKRTTPRPTDGELAILRVLWEDGPSTVGEVQDVLSRSRRTGYTTVLKLLQIMKEKGLVDRDEKQRSHVYRARRSEEITQRLLLRDLLDRAFGGSARKLILQLLETKKSSPAELAEIRRLLKKHGRSRS